ncbi:MAG: hypothetical protein A2451_09360, partial [Bdellovibrionales bacterium RIFOXYC2_FULL_39_8]
MTKQEAIFFLLLFIIPLFPASALLDGQMSDGLTAEEKNTISIYKKNDSAVVNITSIKLARTFWDYSPVEVPVGSGSGFLWDTDGHIVTNAHVVGDSDSFIVTFHHDQKQYKATVVGSEPRKDIAVLKIVDPPKALQPIGPGSSASLLVGQKAVAIGNPFGMDNTLTVGVVSALDRKIEGVGGVKIHGMIQTDASINPGNSGGPLLNSSGELIGMNTVIFSQSGTSSGVGFAVPVDTIKRIVPQLIKNGKVIGPGLGITLLSDEISFRFNVKEGLIIASFVDEKGPLAAAGLRGITRDRYGRLYLGDIILAIDGKKT